MYSDTDKLAIEVVSIASAAIGLLGALLMIGTIIAMKSYRVFAFRLLMYLAISDAGASLVIMTGTYTENESFCQFQGVSRSFFSLAGVLWVDVIAYVLYRSVVQHTVRQKRLELCYLVGVFGYSLLMALLPLSTDSYAESATGFCWLSERTYRTTALVWQLVQFYIPLWLSLIVASWCYYRVYMQSRYVYNSVGQLGDAETQHKLNKLNRLMYYPLVLPACFLFGTINRIYLFANYDNPSVALACLHNGSSNLIGLVNCIVYSQNSQVKQAWRHSLRLCCRRPETQLIDGQDSGVNS